MNKYMSKSWMGWNAHCCVSTCLCNLIVHVTWFKVMHLVIYYIISIVLWDQMGYQSTCEWKQINALGTALTIYDIIHYIHSWVFSIAELPGPKIFSSWCMCNATRSNTWSSDICGLLITINCPDYKCHPHIYFITISGNSCKFVGYLLTQHGLERHIRVYLVIIILIACCSTNVSTDDYFSFIVLPKIVLMVWTYQYWLWCVGMVVTDFTHTF